MNRDTGCFQCTDRSYNCHSACEKYAKYKAEHDALKERIKAIKDEEYKLNKPAIVARARARRRRQRGE
jgi:cell division protein FtsB